VITIDSAIAHLAGAMGRPVWTVLGLGADWRWMTQSNETMWYPSMRLFRQQVSEEPEALFQRVADAVNAMIDLKFSQTVTGPDKSKLKRA
jgi:ADP-heptose:LPS heptosyltransferase